MAFIDGVKFARDAAVSSRVTVSGAIASELEAWFGGGKELVSAANMEVDGMGFVIGEDCTVDKYRFGGAERVSKKGRGGIGFWVSP